MTYAVIFAEGGMSGLIYIVIAILVGISIIGGVIGTFITFIVNSFSAQKKSSKYYLMVFGISALITLIISGMVCGGM